MKSNELPKASPIARRRAREAHNPLPFQRESLVVASQLSSPNRGKTPVHQTSQQLSEKFAPVVEDMNARRLARGTHLSVETVKAWRVRKAFPNGSSLINAANAFPAIRQWLLHEINAYDGSGISGDITKQIQWIEQLSKMDGPNGDKARSILKAMHQLFTGETK